MHITYYNFRVCVQWKCPKKFFSSSTNPEHVRCEQIYLTLKRSVGDGWAFFHMGDLCLRHFDVLFLSGWMRSFSTLFDVLFTTLPENPIKSKPAQIPKTQHSNDSIDLLWQLTSSEMQFLGLCVVLVTQGFHPTGFKRAKDTSDLAEKLSPKIAFQMKNSEIFLLTSFSRCCW